MTSHPQTVFVLGAGFTKAFLPDAPLMTDDYNGDALADNFKSFTYASHILELERARNKHGHINLERLMTRLHGSMPYDSERGANQEISLLLSELKRRFRERLEKAQKGVCHWEEIKKFASYCVQNKITCLTFNYDDLLDKALYQSTNGRWHPDGGYGYFCRPSLKLVHDADMFMDTAPMHLLKLHGSVNWRARRGAAQPYSVDAIMHHEEWHSSEYPWGVPFDRDAIKYHLEPEPFIVPPVLVKSALVEQPVLKLVWSLAYQALQNARQVYFVGYSLPVTDIAAGFLFRETIGHLQSSQIKVINYAREEDDVAKVEVRSPYREIFPWITDDEFDFRGAREWLSGIVSAPSEA